LKLDITAYSVACARARGQGSPISYLEVIGDALSLPRISIDSPIGQALLNKKVDDEVTNSKPNGRVTAYITGIYAARP